MGAHTPIEVFYSYAHDDSLLRNKLEKHLKLLQRQGLITQWHDRHISPGSDWAQAISMHLERASVILLLVSADFLASDYCYSIEMQRALERHQNKEARVIPILLRPCDWKDAPFAQLQALPTNAKPITSWNNQDEAFTDVASGLRRAIEDLSLNGQERPRPRPTESVREAVVQDLGSIPPSLSDLVTMLKSQQQGKAYNLLLTSTISLTPDVLRRICGFGSWAKFRAYLRRIGTEHSNIVDLLSKHVGIHNNLDGY